MSYNPHGTGSVIEHARKLLGHDDPWVSTTSNRKFAAKSATGPGDVYVYTINPRAPYKLTIKDVAFEFQNIHEEEPHPGESEFSVHGYVPWKNIISWETFRRSHSTGVTTREQFEAGVGGSSSAKSHKVRSFFA
jgi:hypothetical protein